MLLRGELTKESVSLITLAISCAESRSDFESLEDFFGILAGLVIFLSSAAS